MNSPPQRSVGVVELTSFDNCLLYNTDIGPRSNPQRLRVSAHQWLADLEARLRGDRDSRTHVLLTSLVQLHRSLEQDIHGGNFSVLTGDVLRHVDQVFNVCVEHLEMAYQLWQAAHSDSRDSSQKLLPREILVDEVQASVQQLRTILDHLHQRAVGSKTHELQRLRAELDQTLRIAKRVEQLS